MNVSAVDETDPSKPSGKKQTITAPFNNMRTLKFKAQPTNSFFATVNQMFGGSSSVLLLPSAR